MITRGNVIQRVLTISEKFRLARSFPIEGAIFGRNYIHTVSQQQQLVSKLLFIHALFMPFPRGVNNSYCFEAPFIKEKHIEAPLSVWHNDNASGKVIDRPLFVRLAA